MGSLNKVFLIGNLGRDPEVRHTASGTTVANFSLCTNERVKDGDEWKDKAEWHSCVAWNKTAELVQKYLAKGSQVHVEGKLQTRSYDKDGVKHYRTEIVVFAVQFLGGKKSDGDAAPATSGAPADDFGAGPDDDLPF